jgi:hypothetical protein
MDRLSFVSPAYHVRAAQVCRHSGIEVIHDMWEFFSEFESVSEGIKARAGKAYDLLKSPAAAFLIVTNLS